MMNFTRRSFLRSSLLSTAACVVPPAREKVITVNGPISPADMGKTLVHEHILVDFIGAEKIQPGRYNPQQVYEHVLPFLKSLRSKGCKTFVECTPAYLGRDPRLLQQLSKAADLHIITNTGWYGAAKEKFLPARIKEVSAKQIAEEWINEARTGIEKTGIKPGFMKISVDDIPFTENILKVLDAAAITYKSTGLPIGVHTSNGAAPAKEQMKILEARNVPLSKWIWIHAQNEKDISVHIDAAKKGAWISFDGISKDSSEEYLQRLTEMKKAGLLNHVLLSQDAGWYDVVEPTRSFRDFMDIFDHFVPMLEKNGFSSLEIDQLLVKNPALAFSVRN